MHPKFIEQYKRMERWHQRLKSIYNRIPMHTGDFEEHDDVLAFFQNCYHLKDWIHEDITIKIPRYDVEDFINESQYLRICADICTASKHLKITKTPRENIDTAVTRDYWMAKDVSGPIVKRTFTVQSGEKRYDALKLADYCVDEWDKFFVDRGISWS